MPDALLYLAGRAAPAGICAGVGVRNELPTSGWTGSCGTWHCMQK